MQHAILQDVRAIIFMNPHTPYKIFVTPCNVTLTDSLKLTLIRKDMHPTHV